MYQQSEKAAMQRAPKALSALACVSAAFHYYSLYLEDYWFDAIRAAGYKSVFVFHPPTELSPHHHRQHDLLNVIPCPSAEKTLWSLSDLCYNKLLPFSKMGARPSVYIGAAIFISQVLVE